MHLTPSCPNSYRKLNHKARRYVTCPCIPHQPIHRKMKEWFLSRQQIFTLAEDKLVSMSRVKSRYFVALMPGITVQNLYDWLDNGCL